MKISKEQVAENRIRILDASARMFREHGFEAVTIAEVMAAAGLTHGAFYGYFSSKDDLIAHTLAHVLNPSEGKPALAVNIKDFAEYYLRTEHRDHPGSGCIVAALGAETVRGSDEARKVFTESVRRQIANFSKSTNGKTEEERRQAAIAAWSAMVGAMIISRVVNDKELSDQVLGDTLAWLNGVGAGVKH